MANAGLELGRPLMLWQQIVADTAMEVDSDTGFLAYREVILSLMRQQGKTHLVLATYCARCLLWGSRQHAIFTMQDGHAARKKVKQEQLPLLEASPLWNLVDRPYLSDGDTNILFKNGSRMSVLSNAEASGEGMSEIDLLFFDEAHADKDDRRERALLSTTATRRDAQIWPISTPGGPESTYFRRKVELGRAAVNSGSNTGVAYFEFAVAENEDPYDLDVLRQRMPGYGVIVHDEYILHAQRTMSEENYRRNVGGQWVASEERVIPEAVWLAVCVSDMPRPEGGLVVGVDAHPDRTAAAIVIADRSARCELVDYRPGTSWVLERVQEVSQRWSAEVVVDVAGPLGGLIDPLKLAKRRVYPMQPREVAYATANLYDRVADGKVVVKSNPVFDAAVAGAQRQSVGDGWRWGRRTSDVDVSPLVALTLALGRSVRKRVSAYAEEPA